MLVACGGGSDDIDDDDTDPENSPPRATGLLLTDDNGGAAEVGDTLSAHYAFSDADNDDEGASIIRWLRNGSVIADQTSSTYVVANDDLGNSLAFSVTPVALSGELSGTTAVSDSLSVANSNLPQAPIARAGADISIIAGETANFNGGGSSDADGAIVSYAWSNQLSGVTASLTYNQVGDYVVTLTVTDDSGLSDSDSLTVHVLPEPTTSPVSIEIDGPSSLVVGKSSVFSAVVLYSDDSQLTSVTWSVDDTTRASIAANGTLTALGAGPVVVTASKGEISSSVDVTIGEMPTLASISISGPGTVGVGQSRQYTATLHYSDSSSAAGDVSWSVDDSNLADVSAGGLLSAKAAGTVVLSAEYEGVQENLEVVITESSVQLESITITGPAEVELNQSIQFTATFHYSDDTSEQGSASWSVNNTELASINGSGLLTGLAAGTVAVTASAEGISSGAINVNVNAPVVTPVVESIQISGPATVMVGQSIPLSAVVSYDDGSTATAVNWSVNNTAIATVSANGMVSGVAAGTAEVSAEQGGVTETVSIAVEDDGSVTLQSIEIFPKTLRTNASGAQQAVAVGTDSEGAKFPVTHLVSWSSDNESVATVSEAGVVSIADASGTAQLSASYSGVTGSFTIENQPGMQPAGFNLYFKKPSDWSKAQIYIFGGEAVQEPLGPWSGQEMNAISELGTDWYGIEVLDEYLASDGSVNFIFNSGDGKQSGDLTRSAAAGNQWWLDATTSQDEPPEGSSWGTELVLLKVIGNATIYSDESPDINLAETEVAAGTTLNVQAGDAPIGSVFERWAGDGAMYVVDPYAETTRLVVAASSTITLQPQYMTQGGDPYKIGRGDYAKHCVACHGEDGVGMSVFPAITRADIEGDYPSIALLAAYISEEMPTTAPGQCTGDSAGDCAYEIAAMIFADAWEAPDNVVGCNIDSFEDMVPQDRNLRLLTRQEYLNSVRDVFGITFDSSIIDTIPADSRALYFDTASFLIADNEKTLGYDAAAADIAGQVVADTGFYNLAPSCGDNAQCVIENFAPKIFRRPLTSAEVSRYATLFTAEDQGATALQALLMSPKFLFRSELGTLDSSTGFYRLDNYEVATLLAYTFWGTTPDQALLTAAASNDFNISQQVERLLNDPKAEATFSRFVEGWLFDPRYNFPMIESPQLQQDMREETIRFVTNTVFGGYDFPELLRANYSYMNSNLTAHYGEPNVSGWEKVTYTGDNAERSGVLGHASFLATHTSSARTSPVKRGVYIRHALLCQDFPPPVAPILDVQLDMSASIEDLFRAHTDDVGCQSCHQFIDETGFAFQNYGMDGLLRAKEFAMDGVTEHAVDGTGSINSLYSPETVTQSGEGVPFSNLRELGDLLVESPNSSACYARQFYRYTSGKKETRADECTVNVYGQKFRNGEQSLKGLMIELTQMPNFTLRK